VSVNEGNHASALATIADILNHASTVKADAWDSGAWGELRSRTSASAVQPRHWGSTLEGVVPLVDAGDCADLSLTGDLRITGFAWGVIYDVATTGKEKYVELILDEVNPHRVWGEPDHERTCNVATPDLPVLREGF
jgi:hypothetical protein